MERTLRVTCDEPDDPNFLRFCDDRENDIPFLKQFKFAGHLSGGLGHPGEPVVPEHRRPGRSAATSGTAAADRNKIAGPGYGDVGSPIGTRWLVTPTTRYAAGCIAPVPSRRAGDSRHDRRRRSCCRWYPRGTELLDRINQLDLSLAKWFEVGGSRRVQLQADVFNILNANPVLGVRSVNFGTAAYSQVSSILNPRVIRFGAQLKW